jgi:hypothetical protein
MAANNLPFINVGLPPAPGPGAERPYFFRFFDINDVRQNNNEENGEIPFMRAPRYSKKYIAELFSGKVFHLSDDGETIGYPDQPAGSWRRPAPIMPAMNNNGRIIPAEQIIHGGQRGGMNENAELPVYYLALIPQPQGGYGPAPAYFYMGHDNMIAEYHSGLVFQRTDNGVVIGYPNEPVGRWVEGLAPAPMNQNGGVANNMNINNENNERVWYVGLPPAPGIGHEEPWYFGALPGQHPDVGDVVCDLGNGLVYKVDPNGEPDRENPVGRWEQGFPPAANNQNGGRRKVTRRKVTRCKVTRRAKASRRKMTRRRKATRRGRRYQRR